MNATVNYSGRYSYQFGTTSGERITSTVLYEETRSGENLVQLSVNYEGGLKRTDVLHLEPQKFKVQGSRFKECLPETMHLNQPLIRRTESINF